MAIEAVYAAELQRIARAVGKALQDAYLPVLQSLLTKTDGNYSEFPNSSIRLDADDVRALSKKARRAARKAAEDAEPMARRALSSTHTFVRNQLREQSMVRVGIDVFKAEPDMRDMNARFVHENVKLIKSLAEDQISEVEDLVVDAVQRGRRHEVVARELVERQGISERRAALIARDQVGTANSQISQARQKAAGVTRYTWSTSHDERVRGNPDGKYPKAKPSHFALDGNVYSFDDPPVSGVNGEKQNPGEPIQCRCSALPYLEDIYATLAAGGSL